jgi:large subunit ribosomal protein L13
MLNKKNRTFVLKPTNIERKWYVVDAKNKTLGRLSTEIANLLRGKSKPYFSYNLDCGDFVVVINSEKIKVTGNKLDEKIYYKYSGHPGGISSVSLRDLLAKFPERALEYAVYGMLPKNKLRDRMMKKLKIFAGPEHTHTAQKPIEYKI